MNYDDMHKAFETLHDVLDHLASDCDPELLSSMSVDSAKLLHLSFESLARFLDTLALDEDNKEFIFEFVQAMDIKTFGELMLQFPVTTETANPDARSRKTHRC